MKLRDIEVNISVADSTGSEHLAEYGVGQQEERIMSCYIASEAGKSFIISAHNGLKEETVVTVCYLDGEYAHRRLNFPGKGGEIEGLLAPEGTQRAFVFADVQFTGKEDESAGHDIQDDLGSIEVRIYRGVVEGNCTEPNFSADTWEGYNQPIHELSKKVGLHRVSLADAVPTEVPEYYRVTCIDGENDPYATFRFMYRPRDMLKAQNIISLPPSPKPDTTAPADSDTRQIRTGDNNGTLGIGTASCAQSHSRRPSSPAAGPSSRSAPQRVEKRRALESTTGTREQSKATKRPREASFKDVKPNVDHVGLRIGHNSELDNASITSAEQIVRYVGTQLDSAKRDLAEKEQIVRYLSAQLKNAEGDLVAKKEQRSGRDSVKREQADRGVLAFSSAVIDLTLD